MTHHSPIQRFLSEVTPAAGPFELLGLAPASCAEADVRRALTSRLERIAAHPQGWSAEADEVRLALHVAAAQVLDPSVRDELIHDSRLARPSEPAPSSAAWHDAARTAIASAGGWNMRAKKRLAAVAIAHRVAPRDLVRAIAVRPSATGADAAALQPPDPLIVASPRDRASPSRRWVALFMLVVMAVATVDISRRLVVINTTFRAAPPANAEGQPEAIAQPSRPAEAGVAPDAPIAEVTRAGARPATRSPSPSLVPVAPEAPQPAPLSEPVTKLALGAKDLLSEPSPADSSLAARLSRAASLSRFNAAAAFLWKGDTESSVRWQRSAAEAIPPSPVAPSLEPYEDPATLTAPGAEGDGTLALELMSLRRQPAQGIEAFRNRRFTHQHLGPVDADAAAEIALFGSPQELRLVARRIVTDQSDNPAMIHALLEALPRASRQSPLSVLIAEVTERSLPHVDEPGWPVRARAALVERLAELLSPRVSPGTDALAAMLARAYRAAAGDTSMTPDEASPPLPNLAHPGPGLRMEADSLLELQAEGDSRDAVPAAAALWAHWLREAEQYRYLRAFAMQIDEIAARRGVRLSLASRPAQRFVAEQASISEVIAAIVSHEKPSAVLDVSAVLARGHERRKASADVFDQIAETERVIAELWLLRFGVGETEGGGS